MKEEIVFDDLILMRFKKIAVSYFSQSAGFFFLCVYFFFEYTRIHQIYEWLGIIPWAQISLLIAFFLALIGPRKLSIGIFGLSFGLFFVHILCSSMMAMNTSWSLSRLDLIINWLVMYFCVVNLVTSKERVFLLLSVIIVSSFKMSQHAAIAWALRGFRFERWGISGPPGWFGDSADLGLQMCIYLAIVSLFFIHYRKRLDKIPNLIFLAMIVTAFATILAAGNRGTLLALTAMALTYLLIQSNRLRNFLILSVVSLLLLWAAPQQLLDRFDTAGSDRTSIERLDLWGNGIEMANRNPIFGVGYDNYTIANARYFQMTKVAHNSPITVAAELGFVGFMLYAFLMLKVVWVAFRIRKKDVSEDGFFKVLSAAIILGMSAYFISTLFITVPFYPFLYVFMALLAAMHNIMAIEAETV